MHSGTPPYVVGRSRHIGSFTRLRRWRASIPEDTPALMGARVAAWAKPDRGVRAIATGCSLRMLVARTRAKQVVAEFARMYSSVCCPRELETNCVGHVLRAVSDSNHESPF